MANAEATSAKSKTKADIATHPRVKTPVRLQMEAVECGAACLGIVMEHHGFILSLSELREDCGVSRDGSKASNIVKAAKLYGFKAAGKRRSVRALRRLEYPAILYWNFNHFVVLEGFGPDCVYLNDPASGHRKLDLDEFDAAYTGVVLTIEPTSIVEKWGERPNLFKALWSRLHGSLEAVAYCIATGFLLVLPGILIPVFTQIFLDRIVSEGRADWLKPLLMAMVATLVVQGVVQFLQYRYLRRLKVSLAGRMSIQFFWHLLKLPISFYSQRYAGEIAQRTRLNDNLAQMLSHELAVTAINVIMMVFYGLLMLFYSVPLTLIGITFAAINFIALKMMGESRVEANMRLQQAKGKVDGVSIAAIQSVETLKASGMEEGFFSQWSGFYAREANTRQDLQVSNNLVNALPVLLNAVTTLSIFAIGGWQVIRGELSVGVLVAFQALMANFLDPVGDLVALGGRIQELEGDMNRLDDVLAAKIDPSKAKVADVAFKEGEPLRLNGRVEFRNVTFGYSMMEPPLIESLNFTATPGQRIAFVGGSGSGKSTAANLASGLYAPWSGSIRYDDISLKDISRPLLINSLSMVSQDLFFFEGSVRENLTLWNPAVPDQHLIDALEDAAILDIVLALPGGLDGLLLEGGANLSGGQLQRLEIARALVNRPSILIMDEATSALDSETERIIDENLRLRGCTCLIVAHRLSTIRQCDEIIVLDKGKVVERGSHDELLKNKGHYAELASYDESDGT